jgi:alpha-L-fucosidase
MVKSSRRLDEIWFRSVGNNAIMLLNFPPDRTGNLVRGDVERAIESDRRIKAMLNTNYVYGASVIADSQYCCETPVCKAYLEDDELFYATAADKTSAIIDITLPDTTSDVNAIILGEKVELGERITSFELESLDLNEPKTLCQGTSVGYLRVLRFEKGSYKRLRLTIHGIAAPLTLRALSISCYDEDTSEDALSLKRMNLASLPTAEISISDDRKSAQILFGGIYPFDTVCFNVYWPGGEYKVSAFDGSKYYQIAEGVAKEHFVHVKLDTQINSSYQVKIEYTKTLSQEPDFKVM